MKPEMTSRERIQAAIDHKEADRTPCMVGLGYHVAKDNNVPFKDVLNDLDLYQELRRKTYDALGGSDMVNLTPPCLGDSPGRFYVMPVKAKMPGRDLPENYTPQYIESEIMREDEYPVLIDMGWKRFVKEVLIPRVFSPDEMSDAVPFDDSEIRQYFLDKGIALTPSKPLIQPFETLSFARSLEKFVVDLYRRPEEVLAALDVMLPEMLEMSLGVIDESTESVIMPSGRASGGFISPKFFEKFAFPHIKRMVELSFERNMTVFLHLDQDWTKMLPYFKQLPEGRYVLQLDGMTDIREAKRQLGDRMCIMGDVPARLFRLGTTADVEDYCKKLIDDVGEGGGFILSAGCEEPMDAQFDNIKAMLDTAKTYKA